jgi:hypothetical protein
MGILNTPRGRNMNIWEQFYVYMFIKEALTTKEQHSDQKKIIFDSWLRHYATSRKVAVSIPDEVTGFFS